MTISCTYADAQNSAVIFDWGDGRPTQTIAPDWPGRFRMTEDEGGVVGFLASGGTIAPYVAPSPSTNPVDYQLQRYQFLAMLTIASLDSLVATAIAAITDPVQRAVAQAKYDATQVFSRDDPTLNLLAANAGLTSAQVDTYWMQAKDL